MPQSKDNVELEPYDVLQVKRGKEPWLDFATIRDASDMHYARLAVAGRHPEFSCKGDDFRVMRGGRQVLPVPVESEE